MEKKGAGFTSICKSPVKFLSHAHSVPLPSPCTEQQYSGCLVPVEAYSSSALLVCWISAALVGGRSLRDFFPIWEKMMSGFIYSSGITYLTVHDDHIMLQSLKSLLIYLGSEVRVTCVRSVLPPKLPMHSFSNGPRRRRLCPILLKCGWVVRPVSSGGQDPCWSH